MLSICSLTSGRVSKALTMAPHALGRTNRGQSRHPGANDHDDRGRYFASGGDLAGEKPAEVLGGFDNRAVSGDIGHGAQGVELLRPGNPGYAVHGQHCGVFGGQAFH